MVHEVEKTKMKKKFGIRLNDMFGNLNLHMDVAGKAMINFFFLTQEIFLGVMRLEFCKRNPSNNMKDELEKETNRKQKE